MPWLEKHKNILDFTLSSLLRRKAKNVALIVVYTAVIFILASVMFFMNSIKHEARLLFEEAPEMVVQRLVMNRHDLIPLAYAEKIKEIPGVESVKPRWWGYYFDRTNGANYTLMVEESFPIDPGEIVVGNGVARNLVAKENGLIPFKTYEGGFLFSRIKETLSPESELISSDLVLMREEDFRKVFGSAPDQATDFVVRVRDREELGTMAARITQMFPDTRAILRSDIQRTYDVIFDWRGGMSIVVLWAAVLSFLILAWDKATGLSAEDRKEIGILKAIGWEMSDVLLMKSWEGIVISLTSFLVGVLLAYWHVFFTSLIVFKAALKGWSVLYPDFNLTPFLNTYHVALLFLLTVIPYTLATVVPYWRAATIDPGSALRM